MINEEIVFNVGDTMASDPYDTLSVYWMDGLATDYTVTMYVVTTNSLGQDGASASSIADF